MFNTSKSINTSGLAKLLIATSFLLAGCASVPEGVQQDVQEVRKGPQEKPVRTITGFSDGLRCMDNLFLTFNIEDVVVLAENIIDSTGEVQAGTRDMLISAVSNMTRRSNAIQLITFGDDSSNLTNFLDRAGQASPFENVPPFDIRGSISQLDREIVSKEVGGGATVTGNVDSGGANFSKSTSGTILGLDLSVITTHNMAVIAGVSSHNSVAIYQSGGQAEANASISKIGVNFKIASNRNEGISQALRALVEMSTIELLGRLVKVPYWKCLDIDSTSEEIQREIGDWYYSMSRHGTLVKYIKTLLRVRNYYQGPVDNNAEPEFYSALRNYKANAGLPGSGLDLRFFSAFLNNTSTNRPPANLAYSKPKPAPNVSRPPVGNEGDMDSVVKLTLIPGTNKDSYGPGEEVTFTVQSSIDGYLYCYLSDGEQNIVRFYPNRFSQDGFISKASGVKLPGDMPFSIVTNESGKTEKVFCYVTAEEISNELPDALRQSDFKELSVTSQAEIDSAFSAITQRRMGTSTFEMRVQ